MKIPEVIMWGMGQDFYLIWPEIKLLELSGKIKIVAFAERAGKFSEFDGKPVIHPDTITSLHFDYLLTASFGSAKVMRTDAMKMGIPANKIMTPYMFLWKGFPHECRFIDRQIGRENLLLIIAGWHPILWKGIFTRIEKFLPEDIDVCVVVPGTESDRLKTICEQHGWSYLETTENKLALAQNLAIEFHPNAHFIYKIDEDVFITKNFFSGLKKTYRNVIDTKAYKIGFVVPVLNVNGWGYRRLLIAKGKLDEYEKRFGPACYADGGIPATTDPMAAKYLWELILPLDVAAEEIESSRDVFSICHHRFSIGAFLILRDIWESMGGFRVSGIDGMLGLEEAELCKFCMDKSLAIVCAEHVLAGHLSFGGGQRAFMEQYYEEHENAFMPEP